jgi:hypothetical protein
MPSPAILVAAVVLVLPPLALPGTPAQDPAPARAPTTWVLQIEGTPGALRVRGVSAKPFEYRAPRRRLPSDFRVSLRDAQGDEIASAPLDLSAFCMDRAHDGAPPHVRGDVLVSHEVVCTVKVPALAAAAELRIEQVRPVQPPVVLGAISRADVLALARKDAAGEGGR